MRRVEHLINDIRFNSNQTDRNRFPDIRLMKFFNDAQRAIQAIIFSSDTGGTVFDTDYTTDLVADQEAYDLPYDIYAVSSINSVGIAPNHISAPENYRYVPLRQLTTKERRSQLGYIIKNNQVLVSPEPKSNITNGLRVSYVRKVPTISIRVGKITSFTSGVSITLSNFISEDITAYSDYITVVSADGTIKQRKIEVDSYIAGTISTTTALTGISNGDYVVIGEYATSHSELPEETESLLTLFVERKIYGVDSSMDISDSNVFTNEEKDLILTLFEKKDHDVKYPPITSDLYINT